MSTDNIQVEQEGEAVCIVTMNKPLSRKSLRLPAGNHGAVIVPDRELFPMAHGIGEEMYRR